MHESVESIIGIYRMESVSFMPKAIQWISSCAAFSSASFLHVHHRGVSRKMSPQFVYHLTEN